MATDTLTPEAAVLRRALTQVDPRRRRKDRTMKVLIWGAFVVAIDRKSTRLNSSH